MTFLSKIRRLHDGHRPRVLDLFAGCGGLSLGFMDAGFEIFGSVECDPVAAISHAMNFHRESSELRIHAASRDITVTDPVELISEYGFKGPADACIDIIVGGPPCQAFARVGRAKLREIAEHPEAFLRDPRGNLYLRYLEFVRKLKPLAILMENVPDVLNYGGHNIAQEVCEVLDGLGYDAKYTLLNAVYYGVPQMRERMFLVAYHRSLNARPRWFPKPMHRIDLPKGYLGTRQVAMQTVSLNPGEDAFFLSPPKQLRERTVPAVTAMDALSDLPPITLHLEGRLKKGPRHFRDGIPYPDNSQLNDYQRRMRTWTGFEAPELLTDHVIRYLPRDYAIFARMNPGDQYPEAYEHAVRLFIERLSDLERKIGWRPREEDEEFEALWKATVPPYDPGKFPNKWRKMEADQPARTLMAHLGKDGYSHIHYDSSQARTISVREAARLQSFPDGFVFQGPMNPAFRQIGNAVPPLMARALAREIMSTLEEVPNADENRHQTAHCF